MEIIDSPFLEIVEKKILSRSRHQNRPYSYPRHIAQWESSSHRGDNISRIGIPPKTCKIQNAKTSATANLAVDILQYQLSDRITQKIHLESVRRSLEKRLQIAKEKGDCRLVTLLEDEFEQLEITI